MKMKVRDLSTLLFMLSERSGEPTDHAGFRNMSERIEGIGEDYLYKKIYVAIRNLGEDEELSLREAQLNSVARFLGYHNIRGLIAGIQSPANGQLRSFVGRYHVYVRQNTGKGLVFRSPAEMVESGGKYFLRIHGPSLIYEGQVHIRQGCLFVLLESSEDKSFYHVYKVGTSRAPAVMQGIFSGVSTAFDPIGGRAVMVRVSLSADETNTAFTIEQLDHTSEAGHRSLASYFRDYGKNNLSINKVVGFGFEDLEE